MAGAGFVSSLAGLRGPPEPGWGLGHTGKGRSEDPSLKWFQANPQGRRPRRAELQMLWGYYFILFYISGGKNWFLVWSNAFQVVTSLPQLLPLRVEPGWEEEEWVVGSSFPSSHEATLGQSHNSLNPKTSGTGILQSEPFPSGPSV